MSAVPALRAAGCLACRFSALRLFISNFTGAPIRQLPVTSRRTLGSSAARYSTFRTTPRLLKQFAIEETQEPKHDDGQTPSNTDEGGSDVPWYLEVEPPRHPTLLHEPPPLPEVPEGSPQLMELLVKFAADDLGVDDMSLLDLRELDPPPALGPDLLMLFGTARSERHLHVSADRLVRWLRGLGVSSKADGLLGRNELKRKLRRKARKAKLLGNSGVPRGEDDGISTGWICVNLGTVASSAQEVPTLDDEGRVIGFSVPHAGTTIVVQLMTESRRKELDLEKLWTDILRRNLEKRGSLEAPPSNRRSRDPFSVLQPQQTKRGGNRQNKPQVGQARFYSTVAERSSGSVSRAVPAESSNTGVSALRQSIIDVTKGHASIEQLRDLFAHDVQSKVSLLEQLKGYLESVPKTEVVKHLVVSKQGQQSSFLRLVDIATENLPSNLACHFQLWLQTTGRRAGIRAFDLAKLRDALREVQVHASDLTREEHLSIISAVFAIPGEDDAAVREQSSLAMEIVDSLFTRGEKVLEPDVIGTALSALVISGSEVPEAQRLVKQLEDLLSNTKLSCPTEGILLQLMRAYSTRGNWDRFWEVWSLAPRYARARSERMYMFLYRTLAQTNHRAFVSGVLPRCFEEMLNENPPVIPRGELREQLKACILIADPDAQNQAERFDEMGPSTAVKVQEFGKLWRRIHS